MSNQPEGNIAVSLNNIHNIITRGLQVSIDGVQGVIQYSILDEDRRKGFFTYVRALTSVLNSHHLTEDEIVFPYLHDKLPEAPYDALVDQHRKIVVILNEINLAVDKCERNDQLETNLGKLENDLFRLYAAWRPHIRIEYVEIISKADALIPVEEQLRLVGLASQHGQKTAVPPELTVPFLLYNLPPEDRSVFSKDMPEEVLQHLVPVVWKAQWESMTPYLLV